MKLVKDVMTRDVFVLTPDQTFAEAAALMRDHDVGSVPIREGDKLVGMVTDRDLAVRGLAAGLGPATTVNQVMSQGIKYCFDDDDLDDVARNMAGLGVRRLPVVDRDKRLVGFLALSNVASAAGPRSRTTLLESVARPH